MNPTEHLTEPLPEHLTSAQRIEDMAFENRIRTLTAAGRWDELAVVLMCYGSIIEDREAGR